MGHWIGSRPPLRRFGVNFQRLPASGPSRFVVTSLLRCRHANGAETFDGWQRPIVVFCPDSAARFPLLHQYVFHFVGRLSAFTRRYDGQRRATYSTLVWAVRALDGSWAAPFSRPVWPAPQISIDYLRGHRSNRDNVRVLGKPKRSGPDDTGSVIWPAPSVRGEPRYDRAAPPFVAAHTSRGERWHDLIRTHSYRLAATLRGRRKPPIPSGLR